MNKQSNSFITVVGGKQVFTAEFVFQQIQALNTRISRVRNIAFVLFGTYVITIVAILIMLLC